MSNNLDKPDCGYAWVIVAACFTINFIMAGLAKAAGVLYVALIDVYAVSRETATTPFSLRFCVRNLSGPLVGALGQRFGIRPIVLLGGLVCGLGGILSALAPNVTCITIAWGGIHGLGYGMCNIIHVIIINRYFHKYKGLALGISLTGGCFGTFLLPILLEFLLETYDLKGTFLIIAGISLNVIPAAMLLRSPPWEEKEMLGISTDNMKCVIKRDMAEQGIINDGFDITPEGFASKDEMKKFDNTFSAISIKEEKNNEKRISCNECYSYLEMSYGLNSPNPSYTNYTDLYTNNEYKNHRLSDTVVLNEIYFLRESSSLRVTDKNIKKKRLSCHFNTHRKNSQTSVLSCPHIGKSMPEVQGKNQFLYPSRAYLEATIENAYLLAKNGKDGVQCNRGSHLNDESSFNNSSNSCKMQSQMRSLNKPLYKEKILNTPEQTGKDISFRTEISPMNMPELRQQSAVLQFLKTNIKPMFLIISATMALYVFLLISMFTIIIDYVTDNNIPSEYGKFLIISFSVMDLFGSLGFGVVLDRKLIPISYYAALTTGLMGIFVLAIPLFKCFTFWMISFSLSGFFQGGTCIMFPLLVEHYMEKHEESVALGCLNFYGGLLMLLIPPMIGFFRDSLGSYDGVFWTVGGLCILAGSLWIFEPCIVRKQEKKMCQNMYSTEDGKI